MTLNRLTIGAMLLGLVLGAVQAQQTINVKTKSAGSSTFLISETKKMSYVDGKLVVTKKDKSTMAFPLSDFRILNYNMTTTWDGNEWSHSAPSEADVAVLNGNFNDAGFSSLHLIVNAGKELTIASGQQKVMENIILKSNAADGTATLIDHGALWVGGKASVEQFLTVDRPFWYISSPMSGATTTTFINSNQSNIVLYYKEEESAYSFALTANTGLAIGKGYVLMVGDSQNGVYTFTGGNLNSGDISINATRTGTKAIKRGFNLIGNPYPSYLNWDSVYQHVKQNDILPTIWYRTQTDGNMVFQTYNAALGLAIPAYITGLIPPMQAFWIRVNKDAVAPDTQHTGSINLNNSMRAHSGISGNASNRLKINAIALTQFVRLALTNGKYSDEMLIACDSEASDVLDVYDSQKMSNDNLEQPEIYSVVNNEKLAINGLSAFTDGKTVNIGFKPGKPGAFTIKALDISVLANDMQLVLRDALNGTEHHLTKESSYSFNSSAMESTNRFSLVFKSPGSVAAIDSNTGNTLKVYSNSSRQIVIEHMGMIDNSSLVGIFNTIGQKLIATQLTGPVTVINNQLASGVYLVTVNYEDKHITHKVTIR